MGTEYALCIVATRIVQTATKNEQRRNTLFSLLFQTCNNGGRLMILILVVVFLL
jgi:hypothetical protein